ncbi:hypothetical protein JCM8097_008079 [Rhodosporidiobolus ruineniae]
MPLEYTMNGHDAESFLDAAQQQRITLKIGHVGMEGDEEYWQYMKPKVFENGSFGWTLTGEDNLCFYDEGEVPGRGIPRVVNVSIECNVVIKGTPHATDSQNAASPNKGKGKGKRAAPPSSDSSGCSSSSSDEVEVVQPLAKKKKTAASTSTSTSTSASKAKATDKGKGTGRKRERKPYGERRGYWAYTGGV